MNRMMVVAAAAMLTAASAVAQPAYFSNEARHKCADLAKAESKYVLCLRSGNAGVIQSALAHAVNMKLICPSVEFGKLKSQIDDLAADGGSAAIRYKAYLASLVFENPDLFNGVRQTGYSNPEELFTSVAGRAQMALLDKGEQAYVNAR